MSHRISKERGRMLTAKNLELQELQKQGKPLPKSDRRHKKHIIMRKRQDGFLWRLKDRIKKTGGEMPKHLQEKKND